MIRVYFNKPLLSQNITNKTIWASALLAIFLVSIFFNPEKVSFLTCFFRRATGHTCLTCGLSRSFYAISHLRLQESFKLHLMGPIIYLAMIFLFLKFSFETVARKEIQIRVSPLLKRISLMIFLCLWISFWIIRFFNE